MNTRYYVLFLLVSAMGLFVSCQNSNSKSVRDAARESLPAAPAAPVTPAVNPNNINVPTTSSIGGNTSGVKHYTCPNNCEGSGGAGAGSCPVCNTAYVHNQAWHNQAGNATTPTPTTTTTPNPTTITPPASPEPPQNADGVWHYTCADGCAGGGGGPTACASCGKTLAHNTAYH